MRHVAVCCGTLRHAAARCGKNEATCRAAPQRNATAVKERIDDARLLRGAALAEAQDINLHLKPLRSHFEEIEQAEFEELQTHLEPMMHVVCLVWANSKYYNTPARIIILLQEICNLIILLVRSVQ